MNRRRWMWVVGTLLAVMVGIRVALPTIIRRVAVTQADAALVGRISLDDVDLSLLRGVITLHGLGLHADELPAPDAPPPADAPPPVVKLAQVVVDVSWLAFARKAVEIETLDFDQLDVRLDRAKDGAIVLPRPVPSDAPPAADAPPASSGWDLLVDYVALRAGRFGFRDFAVGDEPHEMEFAIDEISAERLALRFGDTGDEQGRLRLKANLQGGTIAIDAGIAVPAAGPRVDATIDIAGFPIGSSRVYIPSVGWSGLTGTLGASIHHQLVTGTSHHVKGTVQLRDVAVTVPTVERQALAWSTLDIDIADVDLLAQRADVRTVALDGLRLLVRPREPVLLPLILGLTTGNEAPAADPDAVPAKPWEWSVASVAISNAHLDVEGGPSPLDITTAAEVTGLSGDPKAMPHLALRLGAGDGTVAIEGDTSLTTPSFEGSVKIAKLALPPLLAVVPDPAVAVLRRGTLDTDLHVTFRDGIQAKGTLDLSDVDVGDGPDFMVTWARFGLMAREVSVPLGASAGGARRVVLDRVRLTQPVVRLTRTATGIVLPKALAGDGAPPPAQPSQPAPAGPALDVRASDLAIERGHITIEDRTVKPFFRNDIQPADLRLASVQWPEVAASGVELDLRSRAGGSLKARGAYAASGSTLDLTLHEWPLAPMNPYVASSGYGLGGGKASLTSTVRVRGANYNAKNHILLSKLDLRGAEGDSLFQQNFGVPLSLALALMTDLDGNIAFDVPVTGDQKGTKVPLGTIVRQALGKALVGAVTSPLKLIGAVAGMGGADEAVGPTTIACEPGRTQPIPTEAERIEQIAALLTRSPSLGLRLRGLAGADDARRLREDAIRADLLRTSGVVGSVRYVAERTERHEVLAYLVARDAGKTAELSPTSRAWLDAKVTATPLAAAALTDLATKRAGALRAELTTRHGIEEARLTIGDPTAALDGSDKPAVALDLGARK